MRRAARLLCAYNNDERFASPADVPMKLTEAYAIFGYTMSDTVERANLKERFKALAKRHHPDLGGNPKDFMRLQEAHKMLQHHSHEPRAGPGKKKREATFTKKSVSEVRGDVSHENREETTQVDLWDYAILGIVLPLGIYWYYSSTDRVMKKISDNRSRMSPEEMRPINPDAFTRPKHSWHAWQASNAQRDMVREAEEGRLARLEQDERRLAA